MASGSEFVSSSSATRQGQSQQGQSHTVRSSERAASGTKTVSAPKPSPRLSGTQLATAFDGKLERRGTSFGYQFAILLVAGMMVLLPILYLAIIAGAAWLTAEWASYGSGIFKMMRGGRAALIAVVIYITPLLAGGLLVVSMILPMFWRSSKGPKPIWVDQREQPLLYAYIERLCTVMGAPMPKRIDVIATANASAHIDNGIFGLISRRMVLTIGLPLVAVMDLQQFTGVLAHEFGHFSQSIFMRLSYLIHIINGWFGRMAWGRSGIDDMLDQADSDTHWSFVFVALICKLVLFLARLVMTAMAILSQALCMHLSRQAEFDADRQAARIVGSEPLSTGLQLLSSIDIANTMAITSAQAGWAKRELPDDLVLLTQHLQKHMSESVKNKVDAAILTSASSWFDTHPPLFKRIGALKKAKYTGVLKLNAPATELFKEFDELCKIATIDLYDSAIGKALKPEYLVTTVLPKAKSK